MLQPHELPFCQKVSDELYIGPIDPRWMDWLFGKEDAECDEIMRRVCAQTSGNEMTDA